MTIEERKRIERLRKNGNSFSRIAEITGLSRNNIVPVKSGDSCCQQCGKELSANTGVSDHVNKEIEPSFSPKSPFALSLRVKEIIYYAT